MAEVLGSTAQSLWFADGTSYPGQDDLRERRRRMLDALAGVYAALPEGQELLVEYKPFEPAFYATDLADWGSSLLVCQRLGERARVLVDLGHHAQGTNVEQIVALLAAEGRLGGFHFNSRKYADDDLIVGSVNPFELFLIFLELAAGEELPRLTIDQAHNVEPKVEAMVLSVVNLQEAYARALLVDREALAEAQQAGDVLAGHRLLLDAFQTDVRPLCAQVRADLGAAEDPITAAARVGLCGTAGGRARPGGERRGRVGPVSTLERMIALADNRWPAGTEVPADALGQVLLASHLLGSDRAVANFGGGNTSAKGRTVDHVGRELDAIWVKGSGSDLATMEAKDFTPLRLDEVLPLIERSEMSDEEMVAHLARCQLDPAAPRSSIETLLHAFVPATHVHHTHPDAINVLAGTREGERQVAECFGDEAAWIPYIRPGFTLAKQVGTAVREHSGLRLVVLAKHGLVVWGDSAEEAYSRTIEVINEAAEFVNARTAERPRFGGALATSLDRRAVLRDVLPAVRGAVSSVHSKILVVDTSSRAREFVSSRDAAELVTVGAACPDHLVHTKRVPLWVPFDPAHEDAAALEDRVRTLAAAYRDEYRAYVEHHRDTGTEAADPDARVVLIQHVGLVGVGRSPKEARLSRDLYHRAIEVMAGAHALGGFTSLTEEESFAVEYWPLELYKLSLRPPPGELQGKGRARDRRRRRNRTGRRGRARAEGCMRRRIRP